MFEALSSSILIVEDDHSLRSAIRLQLQSSGFSVEEDSRGLHALSRLSREQFDIVLCDLKLPDIDGLQFIDECLKVQPDVNIVLMTGFGSSELALQAMRRGAYDYLAKPFSQEELFLTIKKIEERERLRHENEVLRSEIRGSYSFENIVAKSEVMLSVFETVKRLSSFQTTVLITGESGTGKELIAKALHHNSSRRNKPFVAINCGAIPENLMESELFGHERGAFTDAIRDKVGLFEEATGGTLFLDEIGELPTHLQVKLLRSLQERKIRRVGGEQFIDIDVRVIAATLRNLEQDVATGRFRDDLFYRLNVVSIHIPPLRERPEDIQILLEHFLEKQSKRMGIPSKKPSPELLKNLLGYGWRGNVRELENCVERLLVLSEGEVLQIEALPPHMLTEGSVYTSEPAIQALLDDNLSIKQKTRVLEIELIRKALRKTRGNRTRAAKILELSHRALLYKIKEYGLSEFAKAE
jgi:two-component system response regulator AtoC